MEKPPLGDWVYLFTYGYSLDIYGYGCLRVGIDRKTGEQLGYVYSQKGA